MKSSWADPARQDLDSIEAYISEDNPKAAMEMVIRIIDKAYQLLTVNPSVGRAGKIFGTRELVISGTPYILLYQVREQPIYILRVVHSARKWPKKV